VNQPAGNSTEKPAEVLVDSDGSQAIDPIMQHGEEGTTMNLLVNGIATTPVGALLRWRSLIGVA
jgi:hypothetical protein